MRIKTALLENGKIPYYDITDEISLLVKLDDDMPSKRIIKTKKGRTALAALQEIETKHNNTWYEELKKLTEENNNDVALFYRGTKVTFKEMFDKADTLAKYLAEIGVKSGDEIPCCLSNTPELVYTMLAANKMGIKLNFLGTHFDKDYLKTILNDCKKKIIIFTDNNYEYLKGIADFVGYDRKLVYSLADSLPSNPKETDEYEPSLDEYYYYHNMVPQIKSEIDADDIIDALNIGKASKKNIKPFGNLDTDFLITYTSGSTKNGFPKPLVHSNRSLIVMGLFHRPELSGNPKIAGLRGLAHIHTESNTNLITCISDNLMQGWSVALEPEYDEKKALDYVILNKPNYLNATTSYLIQMAKDYLVHRKFHQDGIGRKLPFLLATFAVGEGTSAGEEKLINRFLREAKAGSGIKIKGMSLPYAPLSIGGGDCEHGGLYYTLWKSYQEKINFISMGKKSFGMTPVPFAHVSVFKPDENGDYKECKYNEMGIIAANSATLFTRYKNNQAETLKTIITDTDGRDWVTANVYGYIDRLGNVHVKGRVGNEIALGDNLYMPFMIEDVILKDTKNILSCTVTKGTDDEEENYAVANIEIQPCATKNLTSILMSANDRISKKFSSEISSRVLYRIVNPENSYPLTGSGKRSVAALEKLNLEETVTIEDRIIKQYNSKNQKTKVIQ